MKRKTAQWVRKAESDYKAARILGQRKDPSTDETCFHCQQSAEKYLKAILQELGVVIPRTHELEHLLSLLLPHDATLRTLRRGLSLLTPYAVEYRYPGRSASKRQAQSALRWATRIRQEARTRLGL